MRSLIRLLPIQAILILLVPLVALADHSVSVEQNGLRYFFSTAQDTYVTYEYVPMEFSVTNISGSPMELLLGCGFPAICFAVWDPSGPFHESRIIWVSNGCGCFPEPLYYTFGPGESFSDQVLWDMMNLWTEELIWRTGTHTLDGTLWSAQVVDGPNLDLTLSLEVEILPGAASAPEVCLTWSTIKALYR
jgi:hypothetical protein